MATQVLRLPRTDAANSHLLVRVTETTANSLDLKFVGTDHEHIYHAGIKDSAVKTLQANNYSGDLEEWKQIVRYVFLHQRRGSETALPDALEGLETVAAIAKSALTITIRKNIGGITQRLGSITLNEDDEREEVSPFEWVDTAVAISDDLRYQLEALQISISGQQDEVSRLTKQLDELVQAKKDHEAELLKKFAVLLNEKKLKIRDQQRLLSGAKIDLDVADATSKAREGDRVKIRPAKGSRKGKRKAQDVDEDGDEEMEDGQAQVPNEDEIEEEQRDETPPRSVADEDTDQDNLDVAGRPPARAQRYQQTGDMDIDESKQLPPRRELPFKRREEAPAAKTPAATGDDDDDDETDDEL